jgi:hypothetical protein
MDLLADEIDDLRAFDEAKTSNDDAIPLAQAIDEIENESDDND